MPSGIPSPPPSPNARPNPGRIAAAGVSHSRGFDELQRLKIGDPGGLKEV
jgi:hypothetical protein